MGADDLRELLRNSPNKFEILSDREALGNYNLTIGELGDLMEEFLTGEEMLEALDLPYVKNSIAVKRNIINRITDSNAIEKLLKNPKILEEFDSFEVVDIVKKMDSSSILDFIKSPGNTNTYKLKANDIRKIIRSLDEQDKESLILDKNFMQEELKISDYEVPSFLTSETSKKTREKVLETYDGMTASSKIDVISSFSDEEKTKILLENRYDINKGFGEAEKLISTFSVDSIIKLINENRDALSNMGIEPKNLMLSLDADKQAEFVSKLEETNLSLDDKKKIVVMMEKNAREKIDKESLPEEYAYTLDIRVHKTGFGWKIKPDFSQDMEIYKDLDDMIYINPLKIAKEDREKFEELLEVCPDVGISDNIGISQSTVEEYKRAEEWILSVLESIDSSWSDIQKIAYIDHAIGERISYSANYDTESFNAGGARSLWKIIDSKQGVCNGISQIENYMLRRVGIESEIVASPTHSFIKLNNITMDTKNGIKTGSTILDPTWNLSDHKFGAYPSTFCLSYEEIRKHDITPSGEDRAAHKNDEVLKDATLSLEEDEVRQIFSSIGLADREGHFPVGELLDTVENIDSKGISALEDILKAVRDYRPDCLEHLNSTANVLKGLIEKSGSVNADKCVVNRVFESQDSSKKPVMYVYAKLPEEGEVFYVADGEIGQFIQMDKDAFEERFECYTRDLKRHDGHRPWEEEVKKVHSTDDRDIEEIKKTIAEEAEER